MIDDVYWKVSPLILYNINLGIFKMLAMHVNCSVDAISFDGQLDFPRGAQSGWIMKTLKI